jgi:predicted dehydrogenase
VHDVDPDRAKALADETGARVASSAEEAFRSSADLAIIATLHRDLPSIASLAVENGLDVLIEKPGARTPGELEPVQRLAAARDRVVRVGFNHRFHPSIRKARALLRELDLGDLLYVRARYGHGGRPGYEREWRADRELSGGGELLDQGIHLVDLTRYLEGDVDLAFAELTSAYWDMPVEDNAFLCLRVRTGGTAWLHASWTEWKNLFSFEIAHRRAKIEINGLGGSYGVERLTLYEMLPEMGPPDTTSWEWPREDRSWALELEDVLDAREGGAAEGASIDDAVAALTVIEQAYRS